MDQATPSVWNDTPSVQERIVSAISRIASVMRGGMWQFATQEGLNPAQADVLQLLLSRREGVRLSWLAQQLAISPASASDSVTALVNKGLVQKARAADDGRAVALLLTPAGAELAQRASQSLLFAGNAVSALPAATQEALLAGLLQLIGQLQRDERFPEIRACVTCRHFQPNRHADAEAPHHCGLVNAPLPLKLLRLDCPEHEAADASTQRNNWQAIMPNDH
jgi:DNA-binding MarR family transcriptional regulator